MTDDRIPGTRVPDTPIHRASMWLEDLKFGEGRATQKPQAVPMGDTWEDFIRETGIPITVEQMKEAATYYGENMLRMTTGNRVNFAIPNPAGEGFIDGRGIFASLWLDAFMHGAATALGKTGLSNQEIAERR